MGNNDDKIANISQYKNIENIIGLFFGGWGRDSLSPLVIMLQTTREASVEVRVFETSASLTG